MSEDGYIIRRHPDGGYAAVLYFDSIVEEHGWPDVNPDEHEAFDTVREAAESVEDETTEYGVSVDHQVAGDAFEERLTGFLADTADED